MNDKASGLLGTFYSVGCIFSPVVGGILTDYWGFSTCADTIALICLVWSVIFIAVYFLPDMCIKRKDTKPKSFVSDRQQFMRDGGIAPEIDN